VPGLAALHLLNDGGEVGGDMVGAGKGGEEVRGKRRAERYIKTGRKTART
jgi:hypothetical protein